MNSFFDSNTYLDFHTHRLRRKDDVNITEIISLHLGKNTEHKLFTIGKHPWWTKEILSEEEKNQFREILTQKNCLAMGEMGLDKLKGVEIDEQQLIFKSQLKIAQELNKPVIIHCVRAFDKLIKIKREFSQITNWCVHGFSRHSELAKQLLHEGFYLSLMPVKEITLKYVDLVQSLPLEKFFLETDSMPNTEIETIYLQVANIKNISVENLKHQMNANAKVFFNL